MAASSSLQHRHGMVYLDDSSSGEFSAAEADGSSHLHNFSHQKYHPPQRSNSYQASATTRPSYQQATSLTTAAMASSRSSSRGDDSYDEIYSSSGENSYYSDEDDLADYWDPYLYRLQLQAPKPNCIPCLRRGHLPDKPPFYGSEYHGSISREETAQLLGERDGNYLVRKGLSQSGTYSLSFVFERQVRHYKLYYEDGYHYVGEKPFDTIEDLVQDGLIVLYMEANNVEEYLQSARETRISRRANLSSSTGHTHLPEGYSSQQENHAHYGNEGRTIEPVPREDESLGERLEELNVGVESNQVEEREPVPPPKPARLRRPLYQPCTIPLRRDRTNLLSRDQDDELNKEEVEEEEIPAVHHNRGRRGSTMHYSYAKPHNFKLHNYISMMSWCDYCRNFMWGLRNQGFKCKDCGYNAHKQCKDDTAHDCQPSHQRIKKVYGVDLTTLVTMEGHKIPSVIRDTIQEIERRGLEVEGIYRMSGKKNDILRLKCKFDSDMSADLSKVEDIHALTGALKLYLRELPIPLVTFDSYDLCLIAVRSGSDGECLDMLHKALDRLPPAHYNSLKHLMRHLHEVQLQKEDNRMDSKNLALVFTPSLMRSSHLGKEMDAMQKLPEERKALDLLIQHYEMLFS